MRENFIFHHNRLKGLSFLSLSIRKREASLRITSKSLLVNQLTSLLWNPIWEKQGFFSSGFLSPYTGCLPRLMSPVYVTLGRVNRTWRSHKAGFLHLVVGLSLMRVPLAVTSCSFILLFPAYLPHVIRRHTVKFKCVVALYGFPGLRKWFQIWLSTRFMIDAPA